MDVKKLSDELSVAAQIMPEDLAALKAAGFRSVICNRPDGEGRRSSGLSGSASPELNQSLPGQLFEVVRPSEI